MKKLTLSLAFFLGLLLIACNKDISSDNVNENQTSVYLDYTDTSAKYFIGNYSDLYDRRAFLGRVLFYDKQLSINNAVSCASCHKQALAFADNSALSMGFEGRLTGRNTPAIQNLSSSRLVSVLSNRGEIEFSVPGLFWDQRENDLKVMVLRPVNNHVEMGISDMNILPEKLNRLDYYKKLLKGANYGEELTLDNIADALSLFMVAIQSNNTRFDLFNAERATFTAQEQLGLHLFNTKYNCGSCHRPFDQGYVGQQTFFDVVGNIGLDVVSKDKGIGAVTKNPDQDGVFKLPNLRNIMLTAPYMHDGRYETLEDVIKHYSTGINDNPNLDIRLRDKDGNPLKMEISDDETTAIIAFLNTLTDYQMITEPNYSNPFKVK